MAKQFFRPSKHPVMELLSSVCPTCVHEAIVVYHVPSDHLACGAGDDYGALQQVRHGTCRG